MYISYWKHFFDKKRITGNIFFLGFGLFMMIAVIIGIIREGITWPSLAAMVLEVLFLSGIFFLNYKNWKLK